MLDYSTIEEKCAEWNVSIRHAQYLCRNGKINGAIKRAGIWFIPHDSQIPVKNTKSDNAKDYKFVGTKRKIFDKALELFMTEGFNSVSLKDIAHSVGIRQSTIYSHFKSKQEILDTIYNFYCHHYIKERISLADMGPILQNESLMDIIRCISYVFKEDYLQRMTDISQMILQRIGADDYARDISKKLIVEEGVKYTEDVFNNAINGGRLAPFDTHLMSLFINIIRIFTLFYWIIEPSPENRGKLLEDVQALYGYALKFIVDLKPLHTSSGKA